MLLILSPIFLFLFLFLFFWSLQWKETKQKHTIYCWVFVTHIPFFCFFEPYNGKKKNQNILYIVGVGRVMNCFFYHLPHPPTHPESFVMKKFDDVKNPYKKIILYVFLCRRNIWYNFHWFTQIFTIHWIRWYRTIIWT